MCAIPGLFTCVTWLIMHTYDFEDICIRTFVSFSLVRTYVQAHPPYCTTATHTAVHTATHCKAHCNGLQSCQSSRHTPIVSWHHNPLLLLQYTLFLLRQRNSHLLYSILDAFAPVPLLLSASSLHLSVSSCVFLCLCRCLWLSVDVSGCLASCCLASLVSVSVSVFVSVFVSLFPLSRPHCPTWMSHVPYEWVMCWVTHPSQRLIWEWVMSRPHLFSFSFLRALSHAPRLFACAIPHFWTHTHRIYLFLL